MSLRAILDGFVLSRLLRTHPCPSSLRQSMKANRAAPTGEGRQESTVFADVEPMMLEGASVRVYDCAGQVRVVFPPTQ